MFKYITINFEKPICDCFNTQGESRDGYHWNLASDERSKKIYLVVVCKICDTSIVIPQTKVGALFSFDYVEQKVFEQGDDQDNNVIRFNPKIKGTLRSSSDLKVPKDGEEDE